MKIFILDTAGRNAVQYNPSLCEALSKHLPGAEIRLMSTDMKGIAKGYKFQKLLTLMPKSWASKTGWLKLLLRAIESFLNYLYVLLIVARSKPNILHVQWLVFIERYSLERYYLPLLKLVAPKLRLFLTVHNIYPHNIENNEKERYKQRFLRLDKYFDGYFVHLISTKELFEKEYGIDDNKIFVSYHGIYKSNELRGDKVIKEGVTNIIMYGTQTKYKGADILVNALKLLPKEILTKTRTKIIGASSIDLYDSCKEKLESVNAQWINRFVSDDELYCAIDESDLILLPYRQISQSGVLLLALSFHKPILTSRLPSFVETLEGYPEDYFFEPDNPQDLADTIIRFVKGDINKKVLCDIVEELNLKYSWDECAKQTISGYKL